MLAAARGAALPLALPGMVAVSSWVSGEGVAAPGRPLALPGVDACPMLRVETALADGTPVEVRRSSLIRPHAFGRFATLPTSLARD